MLLFSKRSAGRATFDIFCTPFPTPPNNRKNIFGQGEPLELQLNGQKMKGTRFNHSSSIKALILHGFSSNSRNFHMYVSPLQLAGYEVIAFDCAAHGMSEGKRTNAVEYSNLIIKLSEQYGPFNAFIAHSFGGIAVCLALEQLPHDDNTKLVLIAPATETLSAIDGALMMLKLEDPRIKRALCSEIKNISGHDASWFSVRRAMKNITAKTLWVHDKEDDVTPLRDALKVKEDDHPNIDFLFTEGLGHRKIYRDQEVLKTIFTFLSPVKSTRQAEEKF